MGFIFYYNKNQINSICYYGHPGLNEYAKKLATSRSVGECEKKYQKLPKFIPITIKYR